MTALEEKVKEKVNAIIDPETGLSFQEMRLIKELKEKEPGVVRIVFRPSSPICPIALKLAYDIKDVAMKVEGVNKAVVYCRDHLMQETINSIINAPVTTSTAITKK
jgi:metal-sulfur cluster biosynthetic enzyme